MFVSNRPPREIVMLFKRELWKDQRLLEITFVNGQECLAKDFETKLQADSEVQLLDYLTACLRVAQVPKVISRKENSVVVPYIRGIRIFNLFVELDKLEPPLDILGQSLKRQILKRCEERQEEIQRALIKYPFFKEKNIYPAGQKILSIIRILAGSLGIIINYPALESELKPIDGLWASFAWVPFRDATTKNMVLAAPELWLGAFGSEEARRMFLRETLQKDNYNNWLSAPIVDFDFSSCSEMSTPEDDVVSLRFHERTWSGYPSDLTKLRWVEDKNDPIRAALTFLVRYYRFGGRKAAYRLIHPWGHRVRFRHDTDAFYFERLNTIIPSLWPGSIDNIPEVLSFNSTAARSLGIGRPEIDLFIAEKLAEKRQYYVDMYPD